jgi:GGDEF domain-containing protein
MELENEQDKLGEIVVSDSQGLQHRSESIARRGLRALSGWDAATIIEAGKEITSADDLENILQIIKRRLQELLCPPSLSLLLANEREGKLHYAIATGNNCDAVMQATVAIGQGLAGYVAKQRQSVIVTDLQKDARFGAQLEQLPEKDVTSALVVPLQVGDKCVGVIELFNCVGPEGFSEGDLRLLENLADFSAIAVERSRLVSLLVEAAYHPVYDGIRQIDTEISRDRDSSLSLQFSWLTIDLEEGLRSLAESMSHRLFDRLVTQIAAEVNGLCRTPDIARGTGSADFAFRYGEYHFDLFLSHTAKNDACLVARQVHRFFRETVWLQEAGLSVCLPARVAVATYPLDSTSKVGLRTCLEKALQFLKCSERDGAAAANIGILPPL